MNEEGPGAGFFPVWYGALMVVLSLVLVASSVLKPTNKAEVRWKDVSRALTCWVAFTVSVALMPILGFAISFALLTWFIVKVMCGEENVTAIALAIGGAALFYGLFDFALDLSLPRGLFF